MRGVSREIAEALAAPLTLGVEEEFHLVDPDSGELGDAGQPVVEAARERRRDDIGATQADDRLQSELQRSVVETATPVVTDLATVRRELALLRSELMTAASSRGLALLATGSAPTPVPRDRLITPKPRYGKMAELYGWTAAAQLICGFQVHVGVPHREAAVKVVNDIRPWLPVLLALSASSPVWSGADTGYASYRTQVWDRWPTAGMPATFENAADYDQTVQDLVDSQVITDPGMIYFDVRASVSYPTVEIRICDAATTLDEAVLLAGLCRGLVRTLLSAPASVQPPRIELLRAARWQAARFGTGGKLVDPGTPRLAPAADVVRRLLDLIDEALDAEGDHDEVRALAQAALDRGCSAHRQRSVLAAGGSLRDVLSHCLEETARGTAGAP